MTHRADFRLTGCAALLSLVATAHGADRFWANTGTDFNAAASWTVAAPGTGDAAVFSTVAATQPHVTASLTIQKLTFAPNTTITTVPGPEGSGYVLSGTAGTALTLTTDGTYSGARPIYQNTTGTNTIAANITLSATAIKRREFEIRAGALEIAGCLASVDDEVVAFGSQPGTALTLSGDNTFTGSFEHRGGGALNIAHANALSTATLLLGSHGAAQAYLYNLSGADLALPGNNPLVLYGGTGLRFAGPHALDFGAGTVTMSDGDSARNCPIYVLNVSARMTFGGSIGETAAAHGLQKYGPGTLELRGPSSYSSITYVSDGVLLLNHASALSPSGLVLRGGSTDSTIGVLGLGAGDFTRPLGTGAGQVQWTGGGGFYTRGGFAAYNADRIVNLGGASAPVAWGVTNFCGTTLALGAADADAMVDFQNPVDLNGVNPVIYTGDGSADIDARVSGVISSAASAKGIIKTGTGTLELTAANTYTGATTVNGGRLLVTGAISTGTTTVNVGGTLGGSGTVNGAVDVKAGATLDAGSLVGTLTLTKNLTLQDGANVRFDLGSAKDLVLFTGASQVLSNPGAVHWTFVPGAGLALPSTQVLFDWSAATSFNAAGLDISDFVVDNTDMLASFRIAGSTLVVDLRSLSAPGTTILIK